MSASFFTDRGEVCRTGGLVGEGGEGRVYKVSTATSLVAKIYREDSISPEKSRKIQAMALSPVRDPTLNSLGHHSIAWVESLLFEDVARTKFVGYTMPMIDRRLFAEGQRCYEPDDRIATFGGDFSWKHLLQAASNLSSCITAIHQEGHRVGDLGGRNFLVSRQALVTLIDCDSFEIHDKASGATYPTTVGTSEWLPPEFLAPGDPAGNHLDRYYSDLFALAVLVFKFLMLGAHPYAARGAGVKGLRSVEALTLAGLFPYQTTRKDIRPPAYAPAYRILPPGIRQLFRQAFVSGHKNPAARPSARQWHHTLQKETLKLRECRASANHFFGAHLRSCPWHSDFEVGQDPFPLHAVPRPRQVPRSKSGTPKRRVVRPATASPPAFRPQRTSPTPGPSSPSPSGMPSPSPSSPTPTPFPWPPAKPAPAPWSPGPAPWSPGPPIPSVPPMPSLFDVEMQGRFLRKRPELVPKKGLQICRIGQRCDLGFYAHVWASREFVWMQPGFYLWDKGQNGIAAYRLDEAGWHAAWRHFCQVELGYV